MKLAGAEKTFGVVLPKTFHDIYETGAMKWLEMSREDIKNHREEYLNDTKAFLMLSCGCEPLLFDEMPQAAQTLKEWIGWQEQDRNVKLSERIKLIPFGRSGGGDMYCFLYRENEEPMVILYCHDEYDDPAIIGHDLDEFLYVQMLEAAENEEDVDGAYFRDQLMYLNEKYRSMTEGKDADALIDDLYSLGIEKANIWS